MDLEFDKEMDALLRKAGRSGVLIGDTAKLHLDADAIAAFAENALPEKSRAIHMQHLSECDPCRKTLANFISLNELEAETAAVAAPAVPILSPVPWYRRLFSSPNLAYTLGGLIVLFGGLIGIVSYQNMKGDSVASVARVSDEAPQRPAAAIESSNAVASNSMANAANAASNASGEIPRSLGTADVPADEAAAPFVQAPPPPPPVQMDGLSSGNAASAQPKPAGADDMKGGVALAKDADKERSRTEAKPSTTDVAKAAEPEGRSVQQQELKQLPSSGPSRSAIQRDNRVYDSQDAMSAKKKEAPRAAAESDSGRRSAGGKNFELKDRVWYDTAYRGQRTENVRRGTDEYRKLDGGLRSIAENIGGVVVVVWGSKAYRIQ